MLGMHGTYEANMAMNRSDLIVAIGSRFDDRVTGRLDAFAPQAKKIHIDIDRASINKVDDPHALSAGHVRARRNCQSKRRVAARRRADARVNSGTR